MWWPMSGPTLGEETTGGSRWALPLLCVYWFNPLLWLAYVLLCRDMEGACDEAVIRNDGAGGPPGYSTALLHCGVRRRSIAACPLAFGEVGVNAAGNIGDELYKARRLDCDSGPHRLRGSGSVLFD